MSGIGGKKREQKEFGQLSVGLAEVKVIGVNPNTEEYKELLGIELKEDSKATEYLGESKDGNATVRIDIWVENVKTAKKDKITFFLENKQRENKDETKKQYINTQGSCSWADDPNNLPDWFVKRDYRVAYNGEEELYDFMRTWLGNLDYRDAETVLQLEWKKLLKGNVSDIKSEIGGEYCCNFVAPFVVKTVAKDGEDKHYQSIWNKGFLPVYALKNFRLVDYNKEEIQEGLKKKKPKEQKIHEKFVLKITGEHGCKDSYYLGDLKDYNPDDFLVGTKEPLDASDPSY
jgi:hypothetical protein